MELKLIFPYSRDDKEIVQAGDFLGRVDSQIMDHFVQKGFFLSQSEFNYQALCPTKIDCKTENAANANLTPKVFVSNLIYGLGNVLKDLSVLMYALTGLNLPYAYAGTSEYTKQVTEGLHRCTTQTRHWEWKDEIERHVGSLDITCQGMHYKRDVFAYKLQKLNAILVFAEPMLHHTCKIPLIFDGPLEGNLFQQRNHTVGNLHFLSKNSFLISRENCRFFFGSKTRENVVVLDFLAVDNLDFTRKIV